MPKHPFLPITLLLTILGGCASAPPDSPRSDVAAMLSERGYPTETADQETAVARWIDGLSERPLTLDTAVRVALVNNPAVTAQYAQLGFSAADVYDAGRLGNPVLSASFLVPDVGGAANQVGFGLAQSFTDLLLLSSRTRLATGEYERVKRLIGARLLEIAADTESAYIDLMSSAERQSMREAIADAANAAAELARRYHAAGNISELELALQEAAATEAGLEVLQARADVAEARATLNALLGLSATQADWKVAERLHSLPPADDEVGALLSLADTSRLDLEAARRRILNLEDSLGVTRSTRLLGEIEAGVETERETDRSRLTGPTLAVELPLFNRGRSRVARAEAALQTAEADLRGLEVDIGNTIVRTSARLAAARGRVEHYRTSLIPLRETIVLRTQEQTNYMLTDPFHLLQAKQQEYAAYAGYLEAVRDYWLARVELRRAVGAPLPSDAGLPSRPAAAEDLPGVSIPGEGRPGEALPREDKPPEDRPRDVMPAEPQGHDAGHSGHRDGAEPIDHADHHGH